MWAPAFSSNSATFSFFVPCAVQYVLAYLTRFPQHFLTLLQAIYYNSFPRQKTKFYSSDWGRSFQCIPLARNDSSHHASPSFVLDLDIPKRDFLLRPQSPVFLSAFLNLNFLCVSFYIYIYIFTHQKEAICVTLIVLIIFNCLFSDRRLHFSFSIYIIQVTAAVSCRYISPPLLLCHLIIFNIYIYIHTFFPFF